MKNSEDFNFSKHSREQIKRRGLSKKVITDVVRSSEKTTTKEENVDVYQKIVKENNKPYLYRVFVNNTKTPPLIITAYKTSKTDKYEN